MNGYLSKDDFLAELALEMHEGLMMQAWFDIGAGNEWVQAARADDADAPTEFPALAIVRALDTAADALERLDAAPVDERAPTWPLVQCAGFWAPRVRLLRERLPAGKHREYGPDAFAPLARAVCGGALVALARTAEGAARAGEHREHLATARTRLRTVLDLVGHGEDAR